MDVYQNGYYKNVRKHMFYAGLWPYADFKSRLFIRCFFIFVLCTSLILQISGFLLLPFSAQLALKFFIRISTSVYCLISYLVLLIKEKEIQKLLIQICNDCEIFLFRNEESKKIFKVYVENLKQIITTLFYLYMWTVITQIGFLILPILFDTIVPINVPKIYKYPIFIGYFEKFQSNFAIIFVALSLIPFVEGIVIMSLGNIFLHLTLHICAMFSVTGYMLENSFVKKESKSEVTQNVQIYKMLVTIINYHNQSIRFLNSMNHIFEKQSACLVFFAICIFTIDTLYFFDIKSKLNDYSDIFMSINLLIMHLFSLIVTCYEGQCVLDHGVDFFMKVYNSPWYVTSPKIQRMYLLILMKSSDPTYLSVGKVFNFSYELVALVLNTSISYAMVFHSR